MMQNNNNIQHSQDRKEAPQASPHQPPIKHMHNFSRYPQQEQRNKQGHALNHPHQYKHSALGTHQQDHPQKDKATEYGQVGREGEGSGDKVDILVDILEVGSKVGEGVQVGEDGVNVEIMQGEDFTDVKDEQDDRVSKFVILQT
jgi:hypothetical protein